MDELDAETTSLATVEVSSPAAGTVLVTLTGELDLSNVESVNAEVAPALTTEPAKLIIDASRLEFADSSAIALWLRWAASVGQVEVRNPSLLLQRVITAMGLTEKLRIAS